MFSTFNFLIFFKIFLVADVLDRLLERQFLLSPWVREKMLRNQLRLVLKVIFPWFLIFAHLTNFSQKWVVIPHQDHLEAGPVRRSTVTKMVHDAHQVSKKVSKFKSTFSMKVFPIWRTQIRETVGKLQGCVLSNWYRYSVTPPNWSDVSCLGPVAGRWSRGRGRCDFCTGALNHFHFHSCTQPLSQVHSTTFIFTGALNHFHFHRISQPLLLSSETWTTTLTFIIIPNHFHSYKTAHSWSNLTLSVQETKVSWRGRGGTPVCWAYAWGRSLLLDISCKRLVWLY